MDRSIFTIGKYVYNAGYLVDRKNEGAKDIDTQNRTKEHMSRLPKATLNVFLELCKEDHDLGGYTFIDYG